MPRVRAQIIEPRRKKKKVDLLVSTNGASADARDQGVGVREGLEL